MDFKPNTSFANFALRHGHHLPELLSLDIPQLLDWHLLEQRGFSKARTTRHQHSTPTAATTEDMSDISIDHSVTKQSDSYSWWVRRSLILHSTTRLYPTPSFLLLPTAFGQITSSFNELLVMMTSQWNYTRHTSNHNCNRIHSDTKNSSYSINWSDWLPTSPITLPQLLDNFSGILPRLFAGRANHTKCIDTDEHYQSDTSKYLRQSSQSIDSTESLQQQQQTIQEEPSVSSTTPSKITDIAETSIENTSLSNVHHHPSTRSLQCFVTTRFQSESSHQQQSSLWSLGLQSFTQTNLPVWALALDGSLQYPLHSLSLLRTWIYHSKPSHVILRVEREGSQSIHFLTRLYDWETSEMEQTEKKERRNKPPSLKNIEKDTEYISIEEPEQQVLQRAESIEQSESIQQSESTDQLSPNIATTPHPPLPFIRQINIGCGFVHTTSETIPVDKQQQQSSSSSGSPLPILHIGAALPLGRQTLLSCHTDILRRVTLALLHQHRFSNHIGPSCLQSALRIRLNTITWRETDLEGGLAWTQQVSKTRRDLSILDKQIQPSESEDNEESSSSQRDKRKIQQVKQKAKEHCIRKDGRSENSATRKDASKSIPSHNTTTNNTETSISSVRHGISKFHSNDGNASQDHCLNPTHTSANSCMTLRLTITPSRLRIGGEWSYITELIRLGLTALTNKYDSNKDGRISSILNSALTSFGTKGLCLALGLEWHWRRQHNCKGFVAISL